MQPLVKEELGSSPFIKINEDYHLESDTQKI